MKTYPLKECPQGCDADVIRATTVRRTYRGHPPRLRKARMILHYRARDEAHFWHWDDHASIVKV